MLTNLTRIIVQTCNPYITREGIGRVLIHTRMQRGKGRILILIQRKGRILIHSQLEKVKVEYLSIHN